MKATIQDNDAISTLDPLDVTAYLRTKGWTRERNTPGKEAFWIKPSDEEGPFEIQLPLDRAFRDYARRMSGVLDTLEIVEQRSQLDIFRDLQTTASDVVRIRLLAKESADGTLPIEQGVELIEHARDLLMASACVTAHLRSWYQRKRPLQAEEYLRSVRLGQTEVGSYVVTMLSRVPPALTSVNEPTTPPEEPFERRVTTKLAEVLNLTRTAAEQSIASGSVDNFKEAVKSGVSVNLCAAIAGLAPQPKSHDGVKVEFTWSPMRPQRVKVPSAVTIPPAAVEVIAEAGKLLRAFAPLEDVKLNGLVMKLESGDSGDSLIATIRGGVEGSNRLVRVSVKETHRVSVIRAFQDRLTLRCTGDVSRDVKIHTMTEYADLTVEEKK